jgi:hypothetical protein
MSRLGCPVFFDATHCAAAGRRGDRGQRELSRRSPAAVAAGADGIFIETHPDPQRARSDRESVWPSRIWSRPPEPHEDPSIGCRSISCGDATPVKRSRKQSPCPKLRARPGLVIEWAREVLTRRGSDPRSPRIGPEFEAAVQATAAKGQVLALGVGKSGLVAKKIAATDEHRDNGDLRPPGRRGARRSDRVARRRRHPPLEERRDGGAAGLPAPGGTASRSSPITCHPTSSLARGSDHVLIRPPARGPEDLVPTATTTAMLALGTRLRSCSCGPGFTGRLRYLHPGGVLDVSRSSVSPTGCTRRGAPVRARYGHAP